MAKAYLSQCLRVHIAKPTGQGPPPGLAVRSERVVEHELEGLRKHARRAKSKVEFVDVLAYAANKPTQVAGFDNPGASVRAMYDGDLILDLGL